MRLSTRFPFLLLCLLAFPFTVKLANADVKVSVRGVSDSLRKNVELYVGAPANDNELNISSFVEDLPKNVRKSLQTQGYYNSTVSISREQTSDEKSTDEIIRISIKAGPPTKISSLNITISNNGEQLTDDSFNNALKRSPLIAGQTLKHNEYESLKSLLFDTAQDRGYFDARFILSNVIVNKTSNTAVVNLNFDSGDRYFFGNIQFDTDTFSDEFLRRWVPFQPNTPYEASLVAKLTQQLQGSGYFSSVRVRTLRDQATDKRVPVSVRLTANPDNQVGVGVGYATDTGPRTKLTWRRPHHNKYGHSLETSIGVSEIRQQFSTQYKIPKKQRPLTDFYLADFGALNEKTDDARSQLRTINFQRVRETSKRWQESVFIRWEHEKFEAADENDTINLLLPGISWSRTLTKGGTNPTWGNHLSVQFMGGHSDFFSDIDVFRSVLSMKWLRTLKTKHKLIMSLDYGAIASEDFDRVPTSHRFYVGGDRSVRGFKYRSISPENDDGELLGGRYMEVGSIEYDYNFYEKWSVATFLDAGRAFEHFDERYRVGTGVGIRWQSPVGPLRIDLGVGISEDDNPVLFHLSLGPDL